jgi:putative transposase
MTAADREAAARRQRAQTIGLWRWALIEPAMDPALTARQRGQVVRALAAREHEGPSGAPVAVSRRTLDRWVVARRAGGFGALVPAPRQCTPRTDADVVELAAGLKMENPARTAAQVRRILAARLGRAPSERAIQRWFAARELNTRPDGRPAVGPPPAAHPPPGGRPAGGARPVPGRCGQRDLDRGPDERA